ncbi:hypothetical protein FB45DRAFT_944419 [Roridomyces roridus]|uniref:Uncharacterized protein n=1 Tax=Roridomyces roridus TaxID=1738132 RepID=A0AAD7B373_9AGAR|nr:hypothetical protein FB45DRAFT_944419 [Roridomyces roridus]
MLHPSTMARNSNRALPVVITSFLLTALVLLAPYILSAFRQTAAAAFWVSDKYMHGVAALCFVFDVGCICIGLVEVGRSFVRRCMRPEALDSEAESERLIPRTVPARVLVWDPEGTPIPAVTPRAQLIEILATLGFLIYAYIAADYILRHDIISSSKCMPQNFVDGFVFILQGLGIAVVEFVVIGFLSGELFWCRVCNRTGDAVQVPLSKEEKEIESVVGV